MRSPAVFIVLAALSLCAATTQVRAQTKCRLPDDMAGEWDWKASAPGQSESDTVPHGRLSFETELNGKAILLRFQWSWPKDKSPQHMLLVIHGKSQGEEKHALYFDEQGRESDCTVDSSTPRCTLTITCDAAVPPKYTFRVRSQDEMVLGFSILPPNMRGSLVPWFSGVAQRSTAPKQRQH